MNVDTIRPHYVEVDIDPAVPESQSVDQQLVVDAIACILHREDTPATCAVNVLLTGDSTLRRLNRQFANEDSVTDVLAFPDEDVVPFPDVPSVDDAEYALPVFLGDIAISIPQVARQALEHGVATERELAMLAIHGTLHLLGYDHATPDEERIMFGKTDAALEQLFSDGHIPA